MGVAIWWVDARLAQVVPPSVQGRLVRSLCGVVLGASIYVPLAAALGDVELMRLGRVLSERFLARRRGRDV